MDSTRLLVFLKQIITKGTDMCIKTKINDEKAKRDYGSTEYRLEGKRDREEMKF